LQLFDFEPLLFSDLLLLELLLLLEPLLFSDLLLQFSELVGRGVLGIILAVGRKVGGVVGREVGEAVGDTVGLFVGDVVGDVVGLAVGGVLGRCVGETVGLFVGDVVGLTVGEVLGLCVGDTVGLFVGDVVGLTVGKVVGASVGRSATHSTSLAPRTKPGGQDVQDAVFIHSPAGHSLHFPSIVAFQDTSQTSGWGVQFSSFVPLLPLAVPAGHVAQTDPAGSLDWSICWPAGHSLHFPASALMKSLFPLSAHTSNQGEQFSSFVPLLPLAVPARHVAQTDPAGSWD